MTSGDVPAFRAFGDGPRRRQRRRDLRRWTLLGPDGVFRARERPGMLGGHRRTRIYGRLDCPAARRAIAWGGYVAHRVFFATEADARAAGYRPCGVCLRADHARWKSQQRSPRGDGREA